MGSNEIMTHTKDTPKQTWEDRLFDWAYDHDRRYCDKKSIERKRLVSFIAKELEFAKAEGAREVLEKIPAEITIEKLPYENKPEIYGNARLEAYRKGHNDCVKKLSTLREDYQLNKEV